MYRALGKTQALHPARNVGLLKLRVPFSVDYASVNHRLLSYRFFSVGSQDYRKFRSLDSYGKMDDMHLFRKFGEIFWVYNV
jgi:hypothetical protein